MKNELDRRRKYYLILDCETATLPIASKWSEEKKKKLSIAKPLIYDLGWTIVDKKGNIYRRQSFLISEIFSVPQVFNTAYYKDKRPIYLERLRHSATILTDWKSATEALVHDMGLVDGVGAYNAMFDFKKALPFTELYVSKVYSEDYYDWEKNQFRICEDIAEGKEKNLIKHLTLTILLFGASHIISLMYGVLLVGIFWIATNTGSFVPIMGG